MCSKDAETIGNLRRDSATFQRIVVGGRIKLPSQIAITESSDRELAVADQVQEFPVLLGPWSQGDPLWPKHVVTLGAWFMAREIEIAGGITTVMPASVYAAAPSGSPAGASSVTSWPLLVSVRAR